jgi:lipopolysaccharide/colanic/teichoic acid biosynthesis glycosyltransferase
MVAARWRALASHRIGRGEMTMLSGGLANPARVSGLPASAQSKQLVWLPSARWERTVERALKRTLDLLGALVLLTALAPVLIVVGLMVGASSDGPVLLRQVRVGKDGRAFSMLKFRTMRVGSSAVPHQAYYRDLVNGTATPVAGRFKLADDPRVTKLGRHLRRTSLDELPQLWNVVRGEMSLVGPRPPLPYEVELYGARERCRLTVLPGMTGLWQVSGRSRLTFHQMIDLDLAYIANWSLWLDLAILARTPLALGGGGRAC